MGECAFCDMIRETNELTAPGHRASSSCQSGKEPHCTCDTCY